MRCGVALLRTSLTPRTPPCAHSIVGGTAAVAVVIRFATRGFHVTRTEHASSLRHSSTLALHSRHLHNMAAAAGPIGGKPLELFMTGQREQQ
jgi:hypothetical protein